MLDVKRHDRYPPSHCGMMEDGEKLPGCNGATSGVAGRVNDGSGGNVVEAEGVVEGQQRFPIDGFIHQAGPTFRRS